VVGSGNQCVWASRVQMQGVGVLYIRWVGDDGEGRHHSITSSSSIYSTLLSSTLITQ
jgi:hypothetical protein